MKTRTLMSSLLALFVLFGSYCQSIVAPPSGHCYFDEHLQNMRLEHPDIDQKLDQMNIDIQQFLSKKSTHSGQLKSGTSNLLIPVVVYIVHNNGPENISDNQVLSQINVLNTYFDPYGIQFCLATSNGSSSLPGPTPGIIRIQNAALTDINANTEHPALAATSSLSDDRYLRIWVVKSINNGMATGYSMLPFEEPLNGGGIVMDYTAFGDIATCGCTTLNPYTQSGKILVHEAGHYLGLYHTFEDGCAGMTSGDCGSAGDRVCDTPPVANPNSGCSANNSCSESPNLPDDINNYMDYTSETCLNQFTSGQSDRMHAMINLYRSQLVSSENQLHTGINCAGSLLANFSISNTAPCTGTSVTFSAVTVTGATYSWDFGDGTTASGQTVNHTYSNAYDPANVILTVSSGTNSVSAIKAVYVSDCSPLNNTESHWYFRDRNAMTFTSGAPVYDNSAFVNNTFNASAISFSECAATQSDQSGNLLFYSDGYNVWNSQHQAIATNIQGSGTSKDGLLSVPDPGNPSQYYLFAVYPRTNSSHGLTYSKIQISGTSASMVSGQVNLPVIAPAGQNFEANSSTSAIKAGESITAVRHDTGYWIIIYGLVNSIDAHLLVYNLTSSGISYHNKIFVHSHSSALPSSYSLHMNLQASPNGKRVAFAGRSNMTDPCYVFDFDPCTGTLYNPRELYPPGSIAPYWLEFSPDSKLLYATRSAYVIQSNLETPLITSRNVGPAQGSLSAIQRGPDNKLYINNLSTTQLSTIHYPNNLCTNAAPNACVFEAVGPVMGQNVSYGLPNIIDANEVPQFTTSIEAMISSAPNECYTFNFNADACTGSYSWNFGDPASGVNNTSGIKTPSHTFSGPGTYTVTCNIGGQTLSTTVEVGSAPSITGTTALCPSDGEIGNYHAVIPNGFSAQWSASGGTVSGLGNQSNVLINWSSLPGVVTLTITNDANGCSYTSQLTVTENCSSGCSCEVDPSFDFLVDDEKCIVELKVITEADPCLQNVTYSWNFGDGNTGSGPYVTHTFANPGTYNICLTVTASNGTTSCTKTYCKEVTTKCEPPCDCKLKPNFKVSLDEKECIYTFEGFHGGPECLEFAEYYWDFGDGTTSMGQITGHVFPAPGYYNVCLTVLIKDKEGKVLCEDKVCKEIEVRCEGKCECKLNPSFTITGGSNCELLLSGVSGSNCVNVQKMIWYVNGNEVHQGPYLLYNFAVNTNYEVCFVVVGKTADGECEEKYCKDFFFTDCYPGTKSTRSGHSSGSTTATLFPNPATDAFTIELPEGSSFKTASVRLLSADGKTLGTYTFNPEHQIRTTIQLPETIASGIVFVEIKLDDQVQTERLIIKH